MSQSDELQDLVREAKNLEEQGKLVECKHKFLDAASYSLKLSKNDDQIKKLSFENIAKELVRYAKEIQLEIIIRKQGFPSIPGSKSTQTPAVSNYQKTTEKITTKPYIPTLHQLLIISEGGIPILKYKFKEYSEENLELNEFLFSGAITAVNQIMEEVLQQKIQTIRLTSGVVMIHPFDNNYFVLFCEKESNDLYDLTLDFCKNLSELHGSRIEKALKTGIVLNEDGEVFQFINNYFSNITKDQVSIG